MTTMTTNQTSRIQSNDRFVIITDEPVGFCVGFRPYGDFEVDTMEDDFDTTDMNEWTNVDSFIEWADEMELSVHRIDEAKQLVDHRQELRDLATIRFGGADLTIDGDKATFVAPDAHARRTVCRWAIKHGLKYHYERKAGVSVVAIMLPPVEPSREEMVEALLDAAVSDMAGDSEALADILRSGFVGYENMNEEDLRDEYETVFGS